MQYLDNYGLLNQISAVPNVNTVNMLANYEYIKSTFTPLENAAASIVPRNYKLLKRNRYLKLI